MSPITTHVLDLSSGSPARGVAVTLEFQASGDHWEELARGVTDSDGRIKDWLPEGIPLAPGTYRLQFETASYFDGRGQKTFYPSVVVHFRIEDGSAHFHVPLLLSPFGYSTYRGT